MLSRSRLAYRVYSAASQMLENHERDAQGCLFGASEEEIKERKQLDSKPPLLDFYGVDIIPLRRWNPEAGFSRS